MPVRAEKFYAAFRLRQDVRCISTVDTDGVLLAAIPGSSKKGAPDKA